MRHIDGFEPWFFICFGVFHLHRLWGLFDKDGYASFWIGVLESRGAFYYTLMIVLATLCVLGIVTFFKNLHHNYWWRWIYVIGGCYVLFDIFAIFMGFGFWNDLLVWMFDISSPYWNLLWGAFALMGAFSLGLGVYLLVQYARQAAKDS